LTRVIAERYVSLISIMIGFKRIALIALSPALSAIALKHVPLVMSSIISKVMVLAAGNAFKAKNSGIVRLRLVNLLEN
jgi:hypothetical protein